MSDKLEQLKAYLANINSVVIKKQWIIEEIDRLQSEPEPEEFCEWSRIKNSYNSNEFLPLLHLQILAKLHKSSMIQNIDIFPRCNICGKKIKEI